VEENVLQLYPLPVKEIPMKGLYLRHDLRNHQNELGEMFILANFISSLDGRISIESAEGQERIPEQIANRRDWRLFQELAVQADLLITSGRYLREYAQGKAQDILRVYDDSNLADLKQWRLERGLKAYPDLAVISKSMAFPVPEELRREGRKVLVCTTRNADRLRVAKIRDQVDDVIAVGDELVDGSALKESLTALGYGVVYSAAGPQIHHLLLSAGVLDRLYLTLANKIIGGERYSSILEGPLLHPAAALQLNTLCYDTSAFNGEGQFFVSYDVGSSIAA
jgi:riboflavin biosynthesis pyrimidine reductase